MSEETEVEVPAQDHDAKIRKMLDDMAKGNAKEVQDHFNDLMGAKINTDLDQRRQELSQNIFNNPDMVKMGLADGEENVLDAAPESELEDSETEEEEVEHEDV